MGVRTRAAGVAAAGPIFLPIIKIGIYKNENEKKGPKVCFLVQRFFLSNSQVLSSLTAIIACRG